MITKIENLITQFHQELREAAQKADYERERLIESRDNLQKNRDYAYTRINQIAETLGMSGKPHYSPDAVLSNTQDMMDELEKAKDKLYELGICPDCLTQFYGPDEGGPFATCKCGKEEHDTSYGQITRSEDWVLAMGAALGLGSGYQVPIVPNTEAFKMLFDQIRATQVKEDVSYINKLAEQAKTFSAKVRLHWVARLLLEKGAALERTGTPMSNK